MISIPMTPLLLKYAGPMWAFGIPGALMIFATVIFWAGRYVERAEGTARLLRAILALRREQRDADRALMTPYLHSLLRALTHVTATYPGFVGEGGAALLADPRGELRALLQPLRLHQLAGLVNGEILDRHGF